MCVSLFFRLHLRHSDHIWPFLCIGFNGITEKSCTKEQWKHRQEWNITTLAYMPHTSCNHHTKLNYERAHTHTLTSGLADLNLFFARRNKFQSSRSLLLLLRAFFFNLLGDFAMSFSLFLTLSLLHNIFPCIYYTKIYFNSFDVLFFPPLSSRLLLLCVSFAVDAAIVILLLRMVDFSKSI